jgi:hypothetical protein
MRRWRWQFNYADYTYNADYTYDAYHADYTYHACDQRVGSRSV